MNIGDYVRTIKGKIYKLTENDLKFEMTKQNCKITSPNIIELLEVGDYVNGCLIVEINKDPFIKGQINLWTNMIISEGEPFPNEYYKAKILEKDIKSIVTHEQFESMEYKL